MLSGFAALAVFAAPAVGSAKNGDVTVIVTVRDAKTHGPLTAAVLLSGAVTVSDLSDVDGEVEFDSLDAGDYRVVVRRQSYGEVTQRFHADAGSVMRIAVEMAGSHQGLRQIASIVVRTSNRDGRYALSLGDAISALQATNESALSAVPGLDFTSRLTSNEPLYASIEGRSPSQTTLTLDGLPLNVPGMAFNLENLDLDLIDRLSLAYGGSGDAAAVSFRTIDPSTTWQSHVDGSIGGFGRSFLATSQQGSFGRLGVALQRDVRSNTSPLDGMIYEDASGLSYPHAANSVQSGDLLKLRYDAGRNAVFFTDIDSHQKADLACNTFTNVLPCGYGPGNSMDGWFRLMSASVQSAIGQSSWSAVAFSSASGNDANFANLIVDGLVLPTMVSDAIGSRGFSIKGEVPIERHELSIAAERAQVKTSQSAASAGQPLQSARAFGFDRMSLSDRTALSKKSEISAGLSLANVSDAGTAIGDNLNVLLRHSLSETSSLSLSAGKTFTPDGSTALLSSPLALQFDCMAKTAMGTAPGDPAGTSSFMEARYTFDKQLAAGEFTVQGYIDDERNASAGVLVNGSAFAPNLFPAGYLQAAQQLYALPTNCGANAVLSRDNLYFATTIAGLHSVYAGLHAQFDVPISPRVVVESNASWMRAAAWSEDPRVTNSLTLFRQGGQLRGAPQLSGYLSARYRAPWPSGAQFFVGAQYSGFGNANALPPNTRLNAAAVLPLEHGALSVLVDNILNTYAGVFAATRWAMPFTAADRAMVPGIAQPYEPRTLTVAYSFGIGSNARANNDVARSFQPKAGEDTLAPGLLLEKWPLTKPDNAFLRNTGARCGATQSRTADEVLYPLAALVAKLDSSKDRSQVLRSPVKFGKTEVEFAPVPGSYALAIRTTKVSVANAIFECGLIHVGVPLNAQSAHLPYPAVQSFVGITFYYTPVIGIYFIQYPPQKGVAQKFRLYSLPASAPPSPFAVNSSAVCLPELRGTAVKLLSELQKYIAANTPNANIAPDWTIVHHQGSSGVWLELRSDEIGAQTAILNCAHVARATTEELKTRGISGARGSFNYSASAGLYILSAQ